MTGAALQSPGAMSRQLEAAIARIAALEAANADLRREMGLIRDTERERALQRHFRLTGKEAALVHRLYETRNREVSKDALLDAMYNLDADAPAPKIIDVFVCKIRAKIRAKEPTPFIETIWGRGYKLTPYGARRCGQLFGVAP